MTETRCAIINEQTGLVENVIIADSETYAPAEGQLLIQSETGGPGDTWNGETFVRPQEPVVPLPVPTSISDRQFFQQLAIAGLITQQEALAAVKTGDIPVALQLLIAGLEDPGQQFAAEMLLSGATVFDRGHALTAAFGAAMQWNDAQVDDLWRAASLL